MLQGLALTPPVLGRISIGRVVEKDGKRLPEKDDEFTITTQVQREGAWVPHPLDAALRTSAEAKLRAIPVRLLFATPELNLRASYSMFDRRTGRPLCVGDGRTCRRSIAQGIETLECPAPEACGLGRAAGCKPYGRLNVRIGDEDELGGFIFRTTGFNSIRTLLTRLQYFHAVSGGLLATLPLELRLRGKSTAQSFGTPIYYVDLTVRTGMTLVEALAQARELHQQRSASGFDQRALDEAAGAGLSRGAFEDSIEEGAAVVDEFYPPAGAQPPVDRVEAPTLAGKLERKLRKATEPQG